MGFTGPGIAVDWMEAEGPLHDLWPPRQHQLLFGALPIEEFVPKDEDELRMAGSCISGDFITHASYRVTENAGEIGDAAGVAAALAKT